MIDKDLVHRKLEDIITFMEELEKMLRFSDHEIERDFFKHRTAERLLQLIVDTMIDINLHLIRAERLVVPDDFQSSFKILAKQSILPMEFAEKIAPIVGLRNRVIHRYAEIDMKRFLSELRNEYRDFSEYVALIKKYTDL